MKLIIDERDLRCTILEGVRKLLGGLDPNVYVAEECANKIADAVVACGDAPPQSDPLDAMEQLIGNLMTTPMRASARAERYVELLVLVNKVRLRPTRVHVECFRMNGTAPCACLDGCGACDSCGTWLGDESPLYKRDRDTRSTDCCPGAACIDALARGADPCGLSTCITKRKQ